MPTLVIVAHPDDEVLGFGGTGAVLATAGEIVRTCILSGDASARGVRPSDDELRSDTMTAQRLLGFGQPILGNFPNIQMNTIPHLKMVQFIEAALKDVGADTLVTHHPNDLNDDHRRAATAAMAAARLHQRYPESGQPPLKALLHMEVLSATDWQFASGAQAFNPDTYVEIGRNNLNTKIEALQAYRGVMRPYPHPRSVEAVEALAILRGAESGLYLAESFVTGFRRWHARNGKT